MTFDAIMSASGNTKMLRKGGLADVVDVALVDGGRASQALRSARSAGIVSSLTTSLLSRSVVLVLP